MKSTALVLCLAAAAVAAQAQTAAKPATPAAKPATAATKPAAATTHAAPAASAVKYPAGIKPVPGIPKTAFSLRYQDLTIGTGPDAEPMKMYKVKYTGWRAADGVIFDSWDQHPMPVVDKDNKPVMGDDGKPKMNPPEPASFPVGLGRMIPGFDQGFTGMKVGGKRRLFIPWQLAYGSREMPDRGADHPGIPAKSNLVFDVELLEMDDLPAPQQRPGMSGVPGGAPHPGMPPRPATPPPGGAPPNAGATTAPSSTPPPASAPAAQSAPAQPSTPPQPK